ncbi:uncharacterized protein FPRO_03382 [Fusarium proliferatum ET1]|uniref:Uncharacterized protein n=1 Tax=Fusarium proliferatum (strain ET1) TaxID=1227346 RepID=A0A1L7V695_FUSPR|nr:uncharacterized protein FPRO_03382 [Fusarium proliferatum ET1]CVL05127.1 uncharacterized protein FPRN_03247 [Fusarium proliferatum]CZR36358.1 uncharacterized protein FPRO_03382 [Fusarium proliferatum ET1]
MPSSGLGPWGGENLKPTLVDGRRHEMVPRKWCSMFIQESQRQTATESTDDQNMWA